MNGKGEKPPHANRLGKGNANDRATPQSSSREIDYDLFADDDEAPLDWDDAGPDAAARDRAEERAHG